jgi:1,4-alpha-glucan branching enzyme
MKPKTNHKSARIPDPRLVPVHFEYNDSKAAMVFVSGTFNDWNPRAEPMFSIADGCWMQDTDLAPGCYEYCLVVDGRYLPDPSARESVRNPYGGRNSILKVFSTPEEGHLYEAEVTPMKTAC